jgi:uncharacterized protein (DUF488 family)
LSRKSLVLYTVGHSTRTLKEFLKLLKAHEIRRLVDVRTVPKSRYVPWFNREKLTINLPKVGVRYLHLPALGGLRHARKDSLNGGWHNASFRGFADYMGTPEFEKGLKTLNALLPKGKTAVMCAEALPWRCHRSLIADAETARGIEVEHLMSPTTQRFHEITTFAVVNKRARPPKVFYPFDNDGKNRLKPSKIPKSKLVNRGKR